jgi:D-alanine-D-alanine ligase-like ATP-grasp enzyme
MALDPCLSPLLHVVSAFYGAKAVLRAHQPAVRRAGEHRSRFYAELWNEAAAQFGATVDALGNDILEIRLGDEWTRVQQNTTSLDSLITVTVAANKPLVHRLLARQGLITPDYCEFTLDTFSKALAFVERVQGECVVKPANGGGGEGVTTGVISRLDLARAAAAARVSDRDLLIERQIKGDVYRLLYLNGKLLDAVLRKPPAVVGDGESTIKQLVNRENEIRIEKGADVAHVLIATDMDMRRTLLKQGFRLSSVLKKGETAELKTVTNENSRRDNISARDLLCKSIIADGAAAAAAVGVRLAGIDIITPDPVVPLAESGGAILEVNATPSYHHHYFKCDGRYPVAMHVLPNLLTRENHGSTLDSVVA